MCSGKLQISSTARRQRKKVSSPQTLTDAEFFHRGASGASVMSASGSDDARASDSLAAARDSGALGRLCFTSFPKCRNGYTNRSETLGLVCKVLSFFFFNKCSVKVGADNVNQEFKLNYDCRYWKPHIQLQ